MQVNPDATSRPVRSDLCYTCRPMTVERDPDDYRDGAICDDVPGARWARARGLLPAPAQRPEQTEEEAEIELQGLRRRAERLVDALRRLDPTQDPPTLPDGDPETLRAYCASIEERIRFAREAREQQIPGERNGWLGHQPRQRTPDGPRRCENCLLDLSRARGSCKGRPGRYR